MILRCGFVLLFLCSIFCDDHIARGSEGGPPHAPHSPNFPPSASYNSRDLEVKRVDVPHEEVPSPKVDPSPEVLTPNNLHDDPIINFGTSSFRDSSYISFTTLVGKRNIDCYFYKARKSFDVDFQVIKGGDFDIALSVFDKDNKKVAFHNPTGDGNLKVDVPQHMVDTDYSICLDNQQASWQPKKVFIMVDVEGPSLESHPDLAFGEYAQVRNHMTKLTVMQTSLSNVYESMMKVEQLQDRKRSLESIDRSIMESNFEYVTLWALLQICAMVVVAIIQLMMIRSLFDSQDQRSSNIWTKISSWSGGRL